MHTFQLCFTEWLEEKGYNTNFEELTKEQLAEILRLFYPSARQKPKKGSTEDFGPPPPYNRTWDLMKDP